MKDMIVLLASVILGIFIFNLIAGDENSVKSELKKAWSCTSHNASFSCAVRS